MKSSLIVDEDGTFRVHMKRETAKSIPWIRAAKDGWFTGFWINIPRLVQHVELTPAPDSVRILKQLREAKRQAIEMKDDESDQVSHLFLEGKKPKPFQHQAINFSLHQKNVLIADDVGLGKTFEAMGIMLRAFELDEVDIAIILCPGSIKYQWKQEIEMANAYLPDFESQVEIVDGDRSSRMDSYELHRAITILHYQCLIRDYEEIWEMIEGKRILVIADEITAKGGCKNRTTKTAKIFKKLFKKAVYKIALTATPIENRLEDLYSVFEWIDSRPFGPVGWFREKYCRMIDIPLKNRGFTIKKVIGYKNLQDAENRIADRYIRRTAADVGVQMPKVVTMVRRVEMIPEARKIYDVMCAQIRAEKAAGAGSMFGKMIPLRRCCAAPCLVGGEGEDSGKIADLLEMMEGELAGESIIIVTQWREKWMDILTRRLKKWNPVVMHGEVDRRQREAARRRFQDGECKVMIMTEVGERGMNLQTGSVLVNLDLPFNPANIHQRAGRIYRMGSPHDRIRVVAFVARDTVEERVLDILSQKGDLFAEVFSEDGVAKLVSRMSKLTDDQWRKML